MVKLSISSYKFQAQSAAQSCPCDLNVFIVWNSYCTCFHKINFKVRSSFLLHEILTQRLKTENCTRRGHLRHDFSWKLILRFKYERLNDVKTPGIFVNHWLSINHTKEVTYLKQKMKTIIPRKKSEEIIEISHKK